MKAKVEAQFKKFMELIKKIHLNVPFIDVLTQMPSYAKFLKENISNKIKLKDHEIVAMTLDSSAMIQIMVILKLKYPRSFSVPCRICTMCPGESGIVLCAHGLCDNGHQ